MTSLTIKPVTSGTWGSVDYSTLTSGIQIKADSITGKLNYYNGGGWPDGAWSPEEAAGTFLPLHLTGEEGGQIKFEVIDGTAGEKTLSKTEDDVVFRIASTSQKIKITSTAPSKKDNVKTYSLTGLELGTKGG